MANDTDRNRTSTGRSVSRSAGNDGQRRPRASGARGKGINRRQLVAAGAAAGAAAVIGVAMSSSEARAQEPPGGIIIRSGNGANWIVTVDDSGNLVTLPSGRSEPPTQGRP